MKALACDACGAGFVGVGGGRCPACGQGLVGEGSDLVVGTPERAEPDRGREAALAALEAFVAPTRYRTRELALPVLAERLERSWWPRWLFDARVQGTFRCKVGTDYEVQSSREVLRNGTWVTEPHVDTRIRWADRVGRVDLEVHDVPADALRDHARWAGRLGPLGGGRSEPWADADGLVRLPDRPPEEVRPEAVVALKRAAAAEVVRALGDDHVDGFTLSGGLDDGRTPLHATWLLSPVYTTWYRDDTDAVRMIWVSGVTGGVWGPRMASPRKGMAWAALWLALGLSMLGASAVAGLVGIVLWPLLLAAAVGGAVGFALMAVAAWPLLAVWRHNRGEAARAD